MFSSFNKLFLVEFYHLLYIFRFGKTLDAILMIGLINFDKKTPIYDIILNII